MPKVSVVIPTYNAIGQVEPLLNQLRVLMHVPDGIGASDMRASNYEVILADDASPDDSGRLLQVRYPWIKVVQGDNNVGFGANVMRGVQAASGDYLFLLNSDVELCGDPITPLVEILASDDSVFAAMPLIYNTHLGMVENLARLYCHRGLCWHTELTEQAQWTAEVRQDLLEGAGPRARPNGRQWTAGGARGRPPSSLDSQEPIPAVLCGAALLCRRERFLQLGAFDPRYRPFYWEDVALGFAAARHSWKCVTVLQALVIHRHSESISAKVGERKLRYLVLNQLRFVHQYRRDLRRLGLRKERLWWLARGLRAFVQGDLQMGWEYLKAAAS